MKFAQRNRAACAALLCAALLAGAWPAAADGGGGAFRVPRQAYDLVVLRPLGLVQLVVSAGFFAAAYPVAQLAGGGDFVWDACIRQPFDRTLRRPLGAL
ncbi:MAG: hypothetical protein OEW02_09630 [Myxococcales bacterium]|nr:hypothetical protein [Myxococcales bacterium]